MRSSILKFVNFVLVLCFVFRADITAYSAEVNPDGSFSHVVPIKTPPGTNGMQPQLALVYNSNSGNGMLGVGWQLAGLPVITRDNSYPINYNGTDHYVGPNGRLILTDTANKIYRYENDNFTKIQMIGGRSGVANEPQYWIETRPDGTKLYYGLFNVNEIYGTTQQQEYNIDKELNSRFLAQSNSFVRAWGVCFVEDVNRNYYTVEYIADSGEYYPEVITYTNNLASPLSTFRTIEFKYIKPGDTGARIDYFTQYTFNTPVQTRWLLNNIVTKVNVTNLSAGTPVRTYSMTYDAGDSTKPSRLKNITDDGIENGNYLIDWNLPIDGLTNNTRTVANAWGSTGYFWTGDFNGDGKTDIAAASGGNVNVKLSTGNGFTSQTWTVTNVWGEAAYTWVGDFNGDGKSDIASAASGNVYMKLSTGNGFTSQTWTVTNVWGSTGYFWTGDFNGDGKTDIAAALSGNVNIKLSTGKGFISQAWSVDNLWGSAAYTRVETVEKP